MRLFNSHSAADRIIYARDRRTLHADEPSAPAHHNPDLPASGGSADEKGLP